MIIHNYNEDNHSSWSMSKPDQFQKAPNLPDFVVQDSAFSWQSPDQLEPNMPQRWKITKLFMGKLTINKWPFSIAI